MFGYHPSSRAHDPRQSWQGHLGRLYKLDVLPALGSLFRRLSSYPHRVGHRELARLKGALEGLGERGTLLIGELVRVTLPCNLTNAERGVRAHVGRVGLGYQVGATATQTIAEDLRETQRDSTAGKLRSFSRIPRQSHRERHRSRRRTGWHAQWA